ncbi:MAG TPA: glycosyltransferase [Nitrospirae bacterium]|nr:glycosyltransferase [Nitrospirota bacterium]
MNIDSMTNQKRPLKLVYCTSWAGGPGHSGSSQSDRNLYRLINRELFDLTLVIADEKDPGEPRFERLFENLIKIQYTGVDNRFENLVNYFSEADIVQFQGGFDPMVCEAAKAARVPALVESLRTIEAGGLYPHIDISICISKSVLETQPEPGKATTIYNGIDLDRFAFTKRGRHDGKIILLQASNRVKSCFNLDEIADEVLSLDPDIEIWLAGAGQTLPSTDRVKFLGLIEDIETVYSKADALVLFTEKEAFGLVVAEAMACGCLPIAPDIGGPAEIVTDGVDGWTVCPSDKNEALNAIGQAVSLKKKDSAKWENMRASARETVERRFSISRCVKQYENIYLDLIKKKGRRIKRGPAQAPPAPEVDIADALFHLNAGRLDRFTESVKTMALREQPIKIPRLALVAQRLAKHVKARGRNDLAELIYRKIYGSGYHGADWMKEWLEITPPGDGREFIIKELGNLEHDDPEIVLLLAEESIETGNITKALDILEEGALKFPDSKTLIETCELLKSKIDR